MTTNSSPQFNESEWLRLLFLISDTQVWVEQTERNLMYQLPIDSKCKLFRKTYYLSAASLAHILERHYYKISRHPGCGKFTISVPDIVHWIREAFTKEPIPISGSLNFKRCLDTGTDIGFDKDGRAATVISIITDAGGNIKTAFPGEYTV